MLTAYDYKLLAEIEEARDASGRKFEAHPRLFARVLGERYSVAWVEDHGLAGAVADDVCDTVCACCGGECIDDDMEECFTRAAIHAVLGAATKQMTFKSLDDLLNLYAGDDPPHPHIPALETSGTTPTAAGPAVEGSGEDFQTPALETPGTTPTAAGPEDGGAGDHPPLIDPPDTEVVL